MTDFAVGQFADDDYRLVKWDGSATVEVGSGWVSRPAFGEMVDALFEYHSVGNSPFSSQEATRDSLILSNRHIPTINKAAGHPWPWDDQ